jgi:hypothetical protein
MSSVGRPQTLREHFPRFRATQLAQSSKPSGIFLGPAGTIECVVSGNSGRYCHDIFSKATGLYSFESTGKVWTHLGM